jgi:hypothetical protein
MPKEADSRRALSQMTGPWDCTAAQDEMWEFIRVAAGLLVAAVTAATLFVMGWPIVTGRRLFPANISERHIWLTACVVALGYAIGLGLPAYALMRWLRLTGWRISPICGFIIGAGPTAIALLARIGWRWFN